MLSPLYWQAEGARWPCVAVGWKQVKEMVGKERSPGAVVDARPDKREMHEGQQRGVPPRACLNSRIIPIHLDMKSPIVPLTNPEGDPPEITRRMVNGFVIESGIPIPRPGGGRFTESRINAGAAELKVGESFLVEEWTEKNRQHCHAYMERAGKRIKTRKEKDGRLRIWRIE